MKLFGEVINLPSSVTAYGWVPFVVAILLSILFSYVYVRHFWCRTDRNKCFAIIAVIGLSIALLAASLLPVDVFLVSYMKNSDGSFKEWATNSTRQALEDSVTYTYYALYSIIFFYTFFILPLAYFSYEEQDEDNRPSLRVFMTALMYTLVFLLLITGLFLAGVFIPFKSVPPSNSTEWGKMEFLIKELYKSRGKDAVTFVVNIITIFGMMNLILYTSVGLAIFPTSLIKGYRSLAEEESILDGTQATTQSKINELRSKQSHKQLTSREIAELADLEEEVSLISRRSSVLESEKRRLYNKCGPCLRFVNGFLGVLSLVFSLNLFFSLLICNIDKIVNSLGMKMGYVLKENMMLNPLDSLMVQAQKIFPLDYVLFFCIMLFLVVCTVSGMRYLGICCFCIPMYKVRPGRTPPQGLIMLVFILMFSVLACNMLVYLFLPTYTTFGNQNYCKPGNSTCELKPCTLDASPDDCVMSRAASFILSFAYKAWIFGAIYFWLSWVFLAAYIISFVVGLIRSRKSSLEEAVDKDDFDDSDEPMVRI